MRITRLLFCSLAVLLCVAVWSLAHAAAPQQSAPPSGRQTPQKPSGERLYTDKCEHCHGAEGRGDRGPALVPLKLTFEKFLNQLRFPLCDMPAFPESELSDAAGRDIYDYVKTFK